MAVDVKQSTVELDRRMTQILLKVRDKLTPCLIAGKGGVQVVVEDHHKVNVVTTDREQLTF